MGTMRSQTIHDAVTKCARAYMAPVGIAVAGTCEVI